ncbi:MAG: FAD-dependent oxidoreductase [Verrucomicrobia bacterium]|nr:FAD-dependent oxidoreductase [Verrucomicrobiota bacterium]
MCLVAITATSQAAPGGNKVSLPKTVYADVCIYGGTSGGVVAGVQASRMGKSAVIIEPGRHLGGMSASGLSWTDVGSRERVWIVGGLAKEFYSRVGRHYGQNSKNVFESETSSDPTRRGYDFAKPPSLSFEPKVAESVFTQWLAEEKVPVYFNGRLKSLRKEKGRIQEMVTDSGLRVRAKVFIDASYEGDLMAMANVSYTVGREANSTYGETINGVQGPALSLRAGKFEVAIDPYKSPGDPSSGLLPYLLHHGEIGKIGSADKLVQSYNYRVCLTDNLTNSIPIAAPGDYDPANYELLARWIEARQAAGQKLTLRDFLKYDPLQNGKYDFNNRWAISTDFIGGAHEYPNADWPTRERIAREHENYLRGFFYFLATNSRVPETVRNELKSFGLCKDEFTDNGGWPHQLYVREARRMISDFVMVEQHCAGERIAQNSIGMGAYGIDMHAVRRVLHDGQPVSEGTIGRPVPAPYKIGYGAIVPKISECENLFVTFALSASHVAFGSIRMEPVFMILSQSAATAACLSIDEGVPVQQVNYGNLADRLRADGQVLGPAATTP